MKKGRYRASVERARYVRDNRDRRYQNKPRELPRRHGELENARDYGVKTPGGGNCGMNPALKLACRPKKKARAGVGLKKRRELSARRGGRGEKRGRFRAWEWRIGVVFVSCACVRLV
jgi:hypothetical protein